MSRVYRLRNKDTDRYINSVRRNFNVLPVNSATIDWASEDCAYHLEIQEINEIIDYLVLLGSASVLDKCELLTYAKVITVTQMKSSIKIDTIRNRIEQQHLVHKLKGY